MAQSTANRIHPGTRRELWQEHLNQWKGSGQSQAAYCRKHGLHPISFSQWKRKLSQTAEIPQAFVEVPIARGCLAGSYAVEIAAGSGITIRLPHGFDPAMLKTIILTLREIPC